MSVRLGGIWTTVLLGLGVAAAGLVQLLTIDPPSGRARAYFFLEAKGLFHVGLLVAAVGLALAALGLVSEGARDRCSAFLRRAVPKLLIFGLLFLLVAEGSLRLLYIEGITFNGGGGPMERRFHRDVVHNRYGGRGPGAEGPKKAGETRILFMGDSILWGQGVKSESDLVSSRTVATFGGGMTAAAICKPGREIDGHVDMIKRWGAEVAPDAIVYEWYLNDCEIETQTTRPLGWAPWKRLFFWPFFRNETFLGQLMDVQLSRIAPPKTGYVAYLEREVEPGAPAWVAFEKHFRDWARHAKSLTPRVVVMLYPKLMPDDSVALPSLSARVRALCEAESIDCLDLAAVEPASFEFKKTLASPFDSHPNADTHGVMARLLAQRLAERWPEVFKLGGTS